MPCYFVFSALEVDIAVSVVGHNDVSLKIGQEYAVAATASHNAFGWLYRTAQMVQRVNAARKVSFSPGSATWEGQSNSS
jgi:predicted P-loop ATPase/GTPase